MSNVLQITKDFFHSAWEFSARLCLLPNQLTSEDDGINPIRVIEEYKKEISAFMNLDGTSISPKHFLMYDQIDTIMQEEVFPALENLTDTWNELMNNPSKITNETKKVFADQCIEIAYILEMEIIAHTSGLRYELQLEAS